MATLADFGREVTVASGQAWARFGGTDWLVPATELALAPTADGLPSLHVSLTRGALPFQPPDPFARLDATIMTKAPLEAVTHELRGEIPSATAAALWPDHCHIDLGKLALAPAGEDKLDMHSNKDCRFVRDIGWDGGQTVASMLRAGVNPLQFSGAAAYRGISPRAGAIVEIRPQHLSSLVSALPSQAVGWEELHVTCLEQLEALGIEALENFSGAQRISACGALADRIFDRLAEEVGTDLTGRPLKRLSSNLRTPQVWDLRNTFETRRWLPLASANEDLLDRFLAAGRGVELISESVLPSFPKSQHALTIYSSFDATLPSLHALGVTVQADANPPDRPSPAIASGVVNKQDGQLSLNLKLARGEPLAYQLSTFAVGSTGNAMWQAVASPQHRNDRLLALGPQDFGTQLFEITLSPQLEKLASCTLEYDYRENDQRIEHSVALNAGSQYLILPLHVALGQMQLSATNTEEGTTVNLPHVPLGSAQFGTHSFKNFGRQTAEISLLEPGPDIVGVQLRPLGEAETSIQTFALNAQMPKRNYSYSSSSLFDPGFEYRLLTETQWRVHTNPEEPLLL